MQNLNYLNYFSFIFFPLQLNFRMWEGGEQLKPKLSSSVLYQMAITLQLFFYPSAQQASTTSNKFAKRGRRAWGFWAQIINLDMLKLSERIILSTLCLESSVIKKLRDRDDCGTDERDKEQCTEPESLGADACSFTLAVYPTWVPSPLCTLCKNGANNSTYS